MSFTISPEDQKILLALARDSITCALEGGQPAPPEIGNSETLKQPCGAFVSLHATRDGRHALRGCIGRMAAVTPLAETVQIMAIEAALNDRRFPPLKKEELPRCQIEISALSPMALCSDPASVQIGLHGLLLKRQGKQAVFLPQVPTQQGWDLEQYFEHLCIKAGLPQGSCLAPDAELYTFTAIVFGEE